MQVDVYSTTGEKQSVISVSPGVFDKPYNEALVHQVITACLASRRAGTHAQKTRAEVRGGGAKPWKQKGMGRARAGTIRSPLWRHGGVTFAARPANYAQKINKKMYQGALRVVLSQLLREQRIKVVDAMFIEKPRTKEVLAIIAQLSLKSPLFIVPDIDENLFLAARNLPHTDVITTQSLNPVLLLRHENILIAKEAMVKLNEALNNE